MGCGCRAVRHPEGRRVALWARGVISTSEMQGPAYRTAPPQPRAGRGLSPVAPPRPLPEHGARKTSGMFSALLRSLGLVVLIAVVLVPPRAEAAETDPLAHLGWVWPATPAQVTRAFVAPAHAYGPGHRGIDLRADAVRSPADGRIAFVGVVAGRDILTIDHGGGLVTTFEPVVTELAMGDTVARAALVGRVSAGGHATPGTVHFGVRFQSDYVNPLRLLGGVPRAVLLPCC